MNFRPKSSWIEAIYGPSVQPLKLELSPIEPLLEVIQVYLKVQQHTFIVIELCLDESRDITQAKQPVKTLLLIAFFGYFTQSLRVICIE